MANAKMYLEQIKRENELHDLWVKAQNVEVVYGGATVSLAAALLTVAGEITALPSVTAMNTAIQTAISQSGHAHFEKATAVPTVETAQENVMYLVLNKKTNHYDIYAKIKGDGDTYTVEQLDDTSVDVSGKMDKVSGATAGNFATLNANGEVVDSGKKPADFISAEEGKRLITTAEGEKLAGIAEGATKVEVSTTNGNVRINGTETPVYTHPTTEAKAAAFRKIGTDATGHVVIGDDVAKEDITALGIASDDPATATTPGLQSAADKKRADASGVVWVGETPPIDMKNGDLFIRVASGT